MQQQDMSLSSTVSFCPSFNSYSTDHKLVDMAAKVSKELNDEKSKSKALLEEEEEINNNEDDDFEFASIGKDLDSNGLFFNGEIRQVFPVFNCGLILNDGNQERHVAALKKLFNDDDDQGKQASSSSSDEDEPEIKRNATFCICSPKRNPAESSPLPSPSQSQSQSPSRCKKSNSTGSSSSCSSKKWFKLRDLLKRSNSHGKDSFVFFNKPKCNNNNNVDLKEKKVKSGKAKAGGAAVSAHEAFYVKNRAIKEGDKKKSYLPYKQDLLGVFANYNALGRTLPPSF